VNAQEFEELVAKAIASLEEARFSEGFDAFSDDAVKTEISEKLVSNLCLRNTKTTQIPGLKGLVEVDQTEHLRAYFVSAKKDAKMFDALKARLADELDEGTALHPIAAQWLASVLRGHLKRPSKRGRDSTRCRNTQICLIIEAIAQYTDHPTRASTSTTVSAIDIVQVALGRSGIASLGFEQLKDIWEEFQRDRIKVDLSNP